MACHRGRALSIFAAAMVALVSVSGSCAELTWPAFRGSDGLGVYEGKALPTAWGAGDIKWRTPIEGSGHSST